VSGANHQLALSIDEGLTWCVTNSDSSMGDFDNPHLLRNVTYANGWFVSGSWRAVWRSRNGYDWEDTTGDQDAPINNWVGQVQYGNGYWMMAGGYGGVARSTDFASWEDMSSELEGDGATRSMAFGNGVFVLGRDNVGWWESADGTDWVQINAGGSRFVYFDGTEFSDHPGYDCDGMLCLRVDDTTVSRSTDGGNNWAPATTLPQSLQRFAFGQAPIADFEADAEIDPAVRTCLGL
jgi:hypothetical protein